jgi:hypothetical protein
MQKAIDELRVERAASQEEQEELARTHAASKTLAETLAAERAELVREREAAKLERGVGESARAEADARDRAVEQKLEPFRESVKLNVGGTRFETTLTTLHRFPESMLATMFSGRHGINVPLMRSVLLYKNHSAVGGSSLVAIVVAYRFFYQEGETIADFTAAITRLSRLRTADLTGWRSDRVALCGRHPVRSPPCVDHPQCQS